MQRLAGFDGLGQGVFVGIFNIHAHGNAAGETTEANSCTVKHIGEIGCSGFSWDGRAGSNQYFIDTSGSDSLSQLTGLEFIGAYAVHRREDAMENMIGASEGPGFLDGDLVARFFHNADQSGVTVGVTADDAGICFGKGEALMAEVDGLVQYHQIVSQVFGLSGWPAEHEER